MMRLFIHPNKRTEQHTENVVYCINRLEEALGAECSLTQENSESIYGNANHSRFSPQDADMIVAVGGDGTVLYAAQYAIASGKPLLGINNGRLGYLCALQLSDMEELTAERFDALKVSQRSLLRFCLNGEIHTALNDVIVSKGCFGESIELQTEYNGILNRRWCGDGMVIATPTGSSAYNLSAGGPFISHEVPAFALTPVCPHDPSMKSVVVSDSIPVNIRIMRAPSGKAVVYADGMYCGNTSGTIQIRRDERTLALMCR